MNGPLELHEPSSTTRVHTYPLQILERDLDTFGHVNNARYLEYFEQARWQLLTDRGYGLGEIRKTRQGPTILEIRIRFLKELVLRDQVQVETWLADYQSKIALMRQRIVRNNEICCYAELTFGLFDTQARKLIEPTAAWLEVIG